MIRVFDYATKTVLPWRIYGDYPAWSPDGAHIAFVGGGGHLWLIDPDGTNQQLVTPLDHYYFEGAPVSWSPDGKWLIALGYPTYRLELVEVATGNALPLGYTANYVAADWK
jgi:Tol biopolymer transport system component